MTNIICGVDVGSETLDARIGQDGAWTQVARTSDGIAALAAFCETHHVDLVVMEATGGYEKLPFAQLWAAGRPCAIVNPLRCGASPKRWAASKRPTASIAA